MTTNLKLMTIRGTKFLLTYNAEDYLDKDLLTVLFNKLHPVRELYINFYLGITRVAVRFKKQLSRTHNDVFDFHVNSSCYCPIIDVIKGNDKNDWKKVVDEFKEEDKMPVWNDTEKKIFDKYILSRKVDKQRKLKEQLEKKKQEKEHLRELNHERRRKLNRERMQNIRGIEISAHERNNARQ